MTAGTDPDGDVVGVGGAGHPSGGVTSAARARTTALAVGIVSLAAGLAAGLLLATALVRPAVPAEGSAEVGFARDMQVHHGQAVEMAGLVRDRSDDPVVRQVALDIMLTQQNQQGQMFGWLQVWGVPAASTSPPMAWASGGHSDMGADRPGMPGLVEPAQVAELAAAEGVAADRLFLELMIPHHHGGVAMAEEVLDRTENSAVRRLAQAIVDAQTAEITILEQMLDERRDS